ncbi:MAG TPA: response regulator transcription factor [Sedimentisphaerales bacterium]|nr:response regulator transcription factor [Sedimentisphaerales bacterium]
MRIVIADDQGMVRQGLRALIKEQPDMEVVGEAQDGWQVVQLAKELSPDIVIMDISMPNLNGVEAARQILRERPDTKIIALSMYPHKRYVTEMLAVGASGYVLKSNLFDELVKALHAAAAGGHYLSPQITDVLVGEYVNKISTNEENGLSRLSNRERLVLQLIAEGLSTKQIALRLCISQKTADANRREIMKKLDKHSVAELTKYAIREGLTTADF